MSAGIDEEADVVHADAGRLPVYFRLRGSFDWDTGDLVEICRGEFFLEEFCWFHLPISWRTAITPILRNEQDLLPPNFSYLSLRKKQF